MKHDLKESVEVYMGRKWPTTHPPHRRDCVISVILSHSYNRTDSTGCLKSHLARKNLNSLAISQRNSIIFFCLKEKCSKVLPFTSIQNFSLFRMSLKTFCKVSFFMALISFSILFFNSQISSTFVLYTFDLI